MRKAIGCILIGGLIIVILGFLGLFKIILMFAEGRMMTG